MAAQVKKPDRWGDAVSYFRKIKKIILREGTFYENGKVTSKTLEKK